MYKFSLCRVVENALSGIVVFLISWALYHYNILPEIEENKLRTESLIEILQEKNPDVPYRSMIDYGVENKIPPQDLENSFQDQQMKNKMRDEKQ